LLSIYQMLVPLESSGEKDKVVRGVLNGPV
jgi:hypothetical protein